MGCDPTSVYISQCALLQSTPQGRIGFDVNVNYVQPHSRTTYANNVTFEISTWERRPYLTLARPPRGQLYLYAGVPLTETAYLYCDGRKYVRESAYLVIYIFNAELNGSAT